MTKHTRNLINNFDALFLDAGGVLLRPNYKKIQKICAEHAPSETIIDKALYVHGIVGAGLGPGDNDDDFVFNFAIASGIPQNVIKQNFNDFKDVILFDPWIPRYLEETLFALKKIQKKIRNIVVVTNTEYGGAEKLLSDLHICQVGVGKGVNVLAVVDSADINIHKPDPEIYVYSAKIIGVSPDRCIHIGDSVRNDVDAAGQAGVKAVHFCPYGQCNDVSHIHIKSLNELVE